MAKVMVRPGDGRTVRLTPGARPMKATGVAIERTLLVEKWIANGDLVVMPAAEPQDAMTPVPAPAPAPEKGAKS